MGGGGTLVRLHEPLEWLRSHRTFLEAEDFGEEVNEGETAIFRGCPILWRWGKEMFSLSRGESRGLTFRVWEQNPAGCIIGQFSREQCPSEKLQRANLRGLTLISLPNYPHPHVRCLSQIPNFIFPVQKTTVNPPFLPQTDHHQGRKWDVYQAGRGGGGSSYEEGGLPGDMAVPCLNRTLGSRVISCFAKQWSCSGGQLKRTKPVKITNHLQLRLDHRWLALCDSSSRCYTHFRVRPRGFHNSGCI